MPALDKPDSPLRPTVKWRFPRSIPKGRKFAVIAGVRRPSGLQRWSSHFVGWLLVGVTIWVAAFFRDPVRTTPRGDRS